MTDWTEARLKEVVIRAAENSGWRVFSTPQIRTRRPTKRAGAYGYPDLTLARDRDGHRVVIWIELKQEKGELTDEQREWKSLLSSYVIRPSDVASGYLLELLK